MCCRNRLDPFPGQMSYKTTKIVTLIFVFMLCHSTFRFIDACLVLLC